MLKLLKTYSAKHKLDLFGTENPNEEQILEILNEYKEEGLIW